MTLADQLIDEAEELAANQIMHPDAYDRQILDALRDIVGEHFDDDSTWGLLALASYRRMERIRNQVNECATTNV